MQCDLPVYNIHSKIKARLRLEIQIYQYSVVYSSDYTLNESDVVCQSPCFLLDACLTSIMAFFSQFIFGFLTIIVRNCCHPELLVDEHKNRSK